MATVSENRYNESVLLSACSLNQKMKIPFIESIVNPSVLLSYKIRQINKKILQSPSVHYCSSVLINIENRQNKTVKEKL